MLTSLLLTLASVTAPAPASWDFKDSGRDGPRFSAFPLEGPDRLCVVPDLDEEEEESEEEESDDQAPADRALREIRLFGLLAASLASSHPPHLSRLADSRQSPRSPPRG